MEFVGEEDVGSTRTAVEVGCGAIVAVAVSVDEQAVRMKSPNKTIIILFIWCFKKIIAPNIKREILP
jgi:hypothetical protein